jgi:hypothetical protein
MPKPHLNKEEQVCPLPRNAILDAKHHATQRLWEGDFAGAWAVVSHIECSDPQLSCDLWVNPVKQAANYMGGLAELEADVLLPIDSIQNKPWHSLLLMAFKVEASLQHNRGDALITEALKSLCTFRENLLEYVTLILISEHKLAQVNLDSRTIRGHIKKIKKHNLARKTKIPAIEITTERRIDMRNMGNVCDFLKANYRQKPLFKVYLEFSKKLEKKNNAGENIRSYRNNLTHGVLSPKDIKRVNELAEEGSLWQNSTPTNQQLNRLGTSFLSSDSLTAIFKLLAPGTIPADLYRAFLKDIIEKIHKPIDKVQ